MVKSQPWHTVAINPGAHIGYIVTCNNVTGWLPKAAGICGVVPLIGGLGTWPYVMGVCVSAYLWAENVHAFESCLGLCM